MLSNWTEVRTAYYVARLGTVSAAADALGLHRATVLRHIDLVENELGEKLFLRHAQGYTPTEAGRELMLAAQGAEERFGMVEARIRAQAQIKAGDLVLTSMPVVAPQLMGAILAFIEAHPGVTVRHVATGRSLKLEKGEAHVAVRSAPIAEEPDNVVQPFTAFTLGLFGSRTYFARRGAPASVDDLKTHAFVAPELSESSAASRGFEDQICEFAPREAVVFRSTDIAAVDSAIEAGVGLGFMPLFVADSRQDLVRVLPGQVSARGELKIVTHVDFHRAARVQALIQALKAAAPADT